MTMFEEAYANLGVFIFLEIYFMGNNITYQFHLILTKFCHNNEIITMKSPFREIIGMFKKFLMKCQ